MADTTHWLSDIELDEVSFVDKGANPGAKISIFKLDNGGSNMSEATELQKQIDTLTAKVADVTKALDTEKQAAGVLRGENEKLKKQLEETTAKAEELKKAADKDKDPMAILKAQMTDEVRKAFEESERQNKANADRIAKMETETAITKCKNELATFANLSIDIEKTAPVLHKMKGALTTDEMAIIQTVFKAADEGMARLYKDSSNNVIDMAGDVMKKANVLAEEIRKSDPKLSLEAARAQVWQKHPELRKELDDSRKRSA